MDESAALELVGKIYDAAYDQSRWPAYLELLRTHTGSASAVLMGFDFDPNGPGGGFGGFIHAPEMYRKYEDYYWQIDEFAAALRRTGVTPGSVNCSHEMVTDQQLASTEFGTDFMLKHDVFYFAGGINFAAGSTLVWCGSVRAPRQGPPDDETKRLHALLMPHVQQALRIDGRMRQLRASRTNNSDVIDRLPYGLIALDHAARLLFLNRMAEDIVVAAAGLRLGPRGLAGLRPREDGQLQAAIGLAMAPAPAASTVILPRPSSPRPLRVIVAPAQRHDAPLPAIFPAPAVLLFLHDPDRVVAPPTALLRSLYGLTPREAELAACLARGAGMAEAAEALQVTPKTAANYLRQVFRKTGARRQADLARLLATLPNVGALDGIDG
jgi:DNA-binding CsgD family transcriptional regulator/PAS domain-containing protein